MVNIGDTVKVWKSVMYREYSTEGVVEAVQTDRFGDQLAKINGDWYKMANDLENKFEIIPQPVPQSLFPQYPNWAKLSRQEQNIILKKHGYRWVEYTREWLEDNDDFDREPGWYLFAPDGREVEVERAFDEINRGVGVVKAEIEAKRQVEAADRERRRQVKAGVQRVADHIRTNGEKPENHDWPQGETLLDSRNIYGSGEAFVIEPDNTVWHLIKNGMDGDDWSRNNLPGHIAFKLSAASTVAEALRQLAAGQPIQGGLL